MAKTEQAPTAITPQVCEAISRAAEEALAPIARRWGLTVAIKGGRYDPEARTFTPKVEFASADSERLVFERNAPLLGLEPGDFERSFSLGGRDFTIVGVNPKATRRPVIAQGTDGKRYSFEEGAVARALGR